MNHLRLRLLSLAMLWNPILSGAFSFAVWPLAAQAADLPVALDVKTTNKLTLEAQGRPPLTRLSPNTVTETLQGTEQSQCVPYGRTSAANGIANTVAVNHDPTWVTLSLTSDAVAHGGHFRTCGSCLANLCVGIFGNDTSGAASAVSQGVITIAFDRDYKRPGDYRIEVTTQGQKPEMTLTDGSGRAIKLVNDDGSPGILPGKPGAIYYLTVSLPSYANDRGGCCEQKISNSATVDVRLSKAPILYTASFSGYIAGGKQTNGYKNVGVFLFDGRVHCSGTVIGPKTVLTAAHCLDGYDKSKLAFVLGSNYQYPEAGPFSIESTTFPDGSEGGFKFNPNSLEDDIGLVRLKTTVAVAPAALFEGTPSWNDILAQQKSLLFVGFGFNVIAGDMVGLGVKREGEWRIDTVQNRVFKFAVPGSNTCYGDSGGPAFVEADPLLLAGVTSLGSSDCTQGTDTKVDAYKQWLKGKIL